MRIQRVLSRGGAGSFAPTQLNGLKHWFKADALTPQSDGSAAPATINDLSSNGANLTKTGTVLYNTNQTPKGGPALRFQRAAFGKYSLPAGFATGFTAMTIYGVLRWVNPADQSEGPWFWGGTLSAQSFLEYGGQIYAYAHGEGRVAWTPSFDPSSKYWVYTMVCGTQFENYMNNVQGLAPSAATFTAYTGTPCAMGDNSASWSGYFAEVLIYNTQHNSTTRAQVYSYLQQRHNLS